MSWGQTLITQALGFSGRPANLIDYPENGFGDDDDDGGSRRIMKLDYLNGRLSREEPSKTSSDHRHICILSPRVMKYFNRTLKNIIFLSFVFWYVL